MALDLCECQQSTISNWNTQLKLDVSPTKLVLNAQDAFIEIVPLPQLAPRTRSTVSDDGRIVLVGQAAHSLVVSSLTFERIRLIGC